MKTKNELIQEIVEIELEMFLTVPTQEKANCQNYPDSFRLHRKAQFNTWSEATLESYLNDLNRAKDNDVNLMTIKYARMDNLIPKEKHNPLIEKIIPIQYQWQKEMMEKYPRLMAGARPISQSDDSFYRISFETYLRGELETYSDETLELLYKDMINKVDKGMNMAEEVYTFLTREMGYGSIEEADRAQRR
ncbi:MAG: DUF4125 family protein [Deltaproteobacteria bacterium]|nr:DUF4125 family protein [Deltaproteobacteria bacterium]